MGKYFRSLSTVPIQRQAQCRRSRRRLRSFFRPNGWSKDCYQIVGVGFALWQLAKAAVGEREVKAGRFDQVGSLEPRPKCHGVIELSFVPIQNCATVNAITIIQAEGRYRLGK
jgi:hypothetical protein